MDNITLEQYKAAVKVIDEYNKQQQEIEHNKTKIKQFLEELRSNNFHISRRLFDALYYGFPRIEEKYTKVEYIEDITRDDFKKRRNCGKKSWDEFCEVKNKFNIK